MRDILLASAALAAIATSSAALAQAQPQADKPAAEDQDGLQDIIVTATRRSTDLQKVAAVVEAVPAETLQAFNVKGVLQLPTLVSGLVVTPSGANNLYMRGIGSASTGYNEAQTAVYIDGLYLANPAMGIYSFNNIDRIEVLKGPQGTLYGRNVTGGLIGITTRDPGAEAAVDASVGYGNYDTLALNVYGSTPLSDTLGANIAVYHAKQSKGWTRNTFTGNTLQKSDETGVEGKLQWKPDELTKVTATGIYDYNNRDFGYAYEIYPGTVANDGTVNIGKYRNAFRLDPNAPFKAYIGMLKAERDLGFAHLASITGYQTSHANVLFPASYGLGNTTAGQGATYNQFYQKNKTFSQELQLTSASKTSPLEWVMGAFYYNDKTKLQLDTFSVCINGVCPPGLTPTRNTGYPTTESISAYGDVTYRIFEGTKLTGGLRYTDETKRLSGLVTPLAGFPNSVATLPATTVTFPGQAFTGFPNGIPTKLHFTKLTYRAVLQQDLGDNVHAYVSHNLGFKSGAFNGNSFTNPPARPELLYATEAGVKSELFDHHVRLNLAYFHYTYKDVQVRSVAPPAAPGNAILQNAAAERMDGIDGDFSIAAFKGFVINGTFEYLNARYKDFPGTSCTTPGTRVVNGVTLGTVTSVTCNLAGFQTPYSPKFSASLGFVYTIDTEQGKFTLSANDHHTSAYNLNAEHTIKTDDKDILDASVTWASPSKTVDLQLWVKNITKTFTYAVGNVSTSYYIAPGAPRTFGATLGVHF